LWLGKIFDKDFIRRMQKELPKKKLKQERRIGKLLFLAENEAEAPPTYYVIDKICDKYGLPAPATKRVLQELSKVNYEATLTHFHRRGIRTNAPANTIKEAVEKAHVT
jgi:tRNA (guanine26-N2/guanine27-N2)-dimethyltransferase